MNLQTILSKYVFLDPNMDMSNSAKLKKMHSLLLIYLLMAFTRMINACIIANDSSKLLTFEIHPPKEKISKWVNRKPT